MGVSGGIAAYKACTVLRLLRESGHEVRVAPTEAALRFVGAPTWEALSGHPVTTSVWTNVHRVAHVELGRWAELVIVAPATADLLARAAVGLADDLLTTSLLTATCPILLSPAMHTEMWQNPATQANVALLRSRGFHVLDPAVGRLTGADSGSGRLPDPTDIVAAGLALLAPQDFIGRHVLVSAGGTREAVDPVRYLGNRSSGRQGVAIAQRAAERGARVTLVGANLDVVVPAGIDVVAVESAEQMGVAMLGLLPTADVIIMAAAVADFRPSDVSDHKIKKTSSAPTAIELRTNPDVLTTLTAARTPGQIFIGFAAETIGGDELMLAGRDKLQRKGCDLLVANDVSGGQVFGQSTTAAIIVDSRGGLLAVPSTTKIDLADQLLDVVATWESEAG
ncbi:MAG: bifunctional phosphopantothenoylcysteine decarboxylase/phosphopantothenate--cysteine ligase CoaBC [Candidatus Nanopelagicales bacterium]|nr:bifunctional phosphopantothenoylcysteine decarboxylase/phosphopantothenate--cysteine ligase CoaBC [Candidatus Nanopelagicales bacterium]MDP4825716.1 bifunctional phosphopantothenoylcysteine decarboxylase/phosphopantothenate--cysteine ligase CoaBC [Candidatus Nanopelagicales bacterium]MDP4888078.1 bifunctional phosphopantothenoylcysteine decarboxylase/phosphopantothenate--cysteine ligase CoaBC [Candidatus Nanopelagicales bacterium]